jgi:ring-1,2-phenylacetyl-CoA epoxidase subunit PaaE
MSLHFHRLTIKEVKKETAECVSLAFDVPATLQDSFQFTQGQNLVLKATLNGQEVRRNYSICSSPLDHELRVAIKKIKGGVFSSFANEKLQAGHSLEVMPPTGKFYTPLDPAQQKNYLALAAGSGITPLLSIIKTTLATEINSSFTLVYGNRTRHSIIFFEQLEGLKNQYMNRFKLIHVLSREKTDSTLNFGRIDQEKLEELFKLIPYQALDDVFLCGPREMIDTAIDFLQAKGLDKKKLHAELFNAGTGSHTAVSKSSTEKSTVKSKISILLDGRQLEIEIPLNSSATILDAALEQGADLPFACKGGMCCTCKAKLVEGEVNMDIHWGLEEEEIEQGFILTCQSHPKTEKIVVDFDSK